MKPKNFPGRKFERQLTAQGKSIVKHVEAWKAARAIRTKKDRSELARFARF